MRFRPANKSEFISSHTLLWVLMAQAASIFPLLFTLPFWVAVVWWVALVWRVQIFRGRMGFPNAVMKIILGFFCIGLIFSSYAGVVGVEPMVGFLVCSFVLKLIEMHTRKDALIILFIGFISIAAQFLFAQSILSAIYGVFALIVLMSAWRAVISKRKTPWSRQLRRSFFMVLQSVPMLLVLFVVMPRLGPLWSVPLPQGQGKTGFSDSLELGDIGELVKSYEVAFHVTFEGVPPQSKFLYWRGLVLDRFDGKQWRASNSWLLSRDVETPAHVPKETLAYSIIIEPHYREWLFSLGYPTSVESTQLKIKRTQNGLLTSVKPITQKAQYQVTSILSDLPNREALLEANRKAFTQFPLSVNPKTQALARQWVEQGLAAEQIVEQALAMFQQSFYYTLAPPALGLNAVDDFLFATQQGFCEHFASSFVLLLRAANIPARVVIGYQGGEFNPEGFMTVRQADAHAWAEVWLHDKGWVTMDPTAAVAPNRILSGVEGALGDEDRQALQNAHWQKRWLNTFNQRWEAMGYSWQRWVLNYDNQKKDAFLSRWLGSVSPWRIAMVFGGLGVAAIVVVALVFMLARRRIYLPIEDKLLGRVIRRLAREGFIRQPSETVKHFAQRVIKRKPVYGADLTAIADAYYAVRYEQSPAALSHFQTKVTQFLKVRISRT